MSSSVGVGVDAGVGSVLNNSNNLILRIKIKYECTLFVRCSIIK